MKPYKIPELNELIELSALHSDLFKTHTIATIPYRDLEYPILGLSMGSVDPQAPTYVLVGGVHGLERIGSRVILAYLESLAQRCRLSESLKAQFKEIRIIAIPVLNPIGMLLQRRSNGNGVDLMRNAPIDSQEAMPFFGGQRMGAYLPFYRGANGAPMESELLGLQKFLKKEIFSAKNVILLDVHSGFGGMDRIWFPYANSRQPFPKLAEASALIRNFELSYPHHPYHIEPQSKSYCTHGDFWDYFFDQFQAANGESNKTLLTLTLEMGSWLWIKKNPLQLFSYLGVFDPILPHRKKRVLRRHLSFLDFLRESVHSYLSWTEMSTESREAIAETARLRWYAKSKKLFIPD
jgi:hypothetical protein